MRRKEPRCGRALQAWCVTPPHLPGHRFVSAAMVAAALLSIHGCDGGLFGIGGVGSLAIEPAEAVLDVGQTFRLRAVSAGGDDLPSSARIDWSSENPRVVAVGDDGSVAGIASGGFVQIEARSGDQSAVARVRVLPDYPVSESVDRMFAQLGDHIAHTLRYTRELLPLNPGRTDDLNEKISLLERPTLATEIIQERMFVEDTVESTNGPSPLVLVFPLVGMRQEAAAAARHASATLPVLEQFTRTGVEIEGVSIWYGFTLGSRGGPGVLELEDRTSYDAVASLDAAPHDAIIGHEVGHFLVRNEQLTQFLEVYGYNVLLTGSPSAADWIWTRRWSPHRETNTGVHALMDIYDLIGADAMGAAYEVAIALDPGYGEPLSEAVQRAFIDAAPPEWADLVAAKIATVTF